MIIQYGEIKKEQNSYPKAIKQLRETLEEEQPELEEYLLELWDKQQQEITAQQYIDMVKKGNLTKEIEDKLLKSYSIFVLGKMLDKKETVMKVGSKEVKKPLFSFDIKYHETKKWIEKDCAEKIVQLSEMQKEAIKLVIDRAETLGFTADTTADLLRPMIGLHKGQVTANINYYNNIKKNLLESNPRMKEATAEKRALEKAKQYAEKQRTYRAMTIARTELAGAYNAGEFYGIKQAQKEGLMGKTKKYPISAGDGRVCRGCKDVEGQEVDIDDFFETQWGKVLFPPFHTSCRCAMGYEEVSEPEEIAHIDEINNPNFIKIKDIENIPKEAIQVIKDDLELIPEKHRKIIKGYVKEIIVEKGKNSCYDRENRIIYISLNPERGEVLHEFAHALETKLKLHKNSKYIRVLNNGLENIGIGEIIYDDETFIRPIYRLENSKFISEYQGRLYETDLNGKGRFNNKTGTLNTLCLGDYFSEGYKEYFINPKHLKLKDNELYKFIKEL